MAKKMFTTRDVAAPVFIPREDRSPQRIVVSTKTIEDVKEAQENDDWKKKVKEATEVKEKAEAKTGKTEKPKLTREEAAQIRKENAKKKKG